MTVRATESTTEGGTTAFHAVIRIALEVAGLAGFALWGWHLGSEYWSSGVLAVVFALVSASIFATFGVPGERGRKVPVIAIPGWVRLTIEIALFAISAYGIWTSWSRAAAETLLTIVELHYAVTWERSRWSLRGSSAKSLLKE